MIPPAQRSTTPPPGRVPSIWRIELTTRTLVMAALAVGACSILLRLGAVVLVLVFALFLVGTLGPIVEWLEKKKIRRGFAVAIVFVSLMVLVVGLFALTIPTLVQQVRSLVAGEPALRARVVSALSHSSLTAPLAGSLEKIDYGSLARSSGASALAYSVKSIAAIAYVVTSIFLALYIMIDRDRLRGGLYALVPRRHHIRLSRILLNLEIIVGGYIRGQVVTSALMAGFTFLLLTVCRVKAALALGVLAGVADVFPYIGVFLSIGPAVAAAASRGAVIVGVVLAAMLAYEELESRFLVPRIYGKVLKLPSSVVLFSLLVGGELLGIAGALLALPIAAAIIMFIQELHIDLPGEDVDKTEVVAEEARAERTYESRTAGMPAAEAAAVATEISEQQAEAGDVKRKGMT